ncbi:hypothetical protein ABK040_003547 [Willaertia magna]
MKTLKTNIHSFYVIISFLFTVIVFLNTLENISCQSDVKVTKQLYGSGEVVKGTLNGGFKYYSIARMEGKYLKVSFKSNLYNVFLKKGSVPTLKSYDHQLSSGFIKTISISSSLEIWYIGVYPVYYYPNYDYEVNILNNNNNELYEPPKKEIGNNDRQDNPEFIAMVVGLIVAVVIFCCLVATAAIGIPILIVCCCPGAVCCAGVCSGFICCAKALERSNNRNNTQGNNVTIINENQQQQQLPLPTTMTYLPAPVPVQEYQQQQPLPQPQPQPQQLQELQPITKVDLPPVQDVVYYEHKVSDNII